MSIRQGLTAAEEHKLKTLISQGKTWEAIVALCQTTDDHGKDQTPVFADVDLGTVKKHLYDPYVKKLEEAKKAGFRSIHDHEADAKKKKAEAAAAKKKKSEEDDD
jgi:hypothetical protein